MWFVLSHLLALCSSIGSVASLPADTQRVLSISKEAYSSGHSRIGVGFDLTASYGTAAVHFANGTSLNVAKISADDSYEELFYRLSLPSLQHLTPPYQHVGDSLIDMPRQLHRKVRKALGLPASQDVGILAKMLGDLRSKVEESIGQGVQEAGMTTLDLIALYDEDLQDAFEYLRMRYLSFPVRYDVLYETSAAYAGYGYGLCSDYLDKPACKTEQVNMPSEVVMPVLYTHKVLTVSLSIVKSAYYLWEPPYRYLSDFDLGYDARCLSSDEQDYWNAVRLRLGEILGSNPYYERPAKILLMGDCVEIDLFHEALIGALDDYVPEKPEIIDSNPEGAAAVGVSKLAHRLPYDPYRNITALLGTPVRYP